MTPYRLVEQVGDLTFPVSEHPAFELAMLYAADLCAASDEERELFVDGPDVREPVLVGRQNTNRN